VLAATFNFLRFCAICKIEGSALDTLRKSMEAWDEKKSPFAQSQELRRMQYEVIGTVNRPDGGASRSDRLAGSAVVGLSGGIRAWAAATLARTVL
jgi:hypothetical protein